MGTHRLETCDINEIESEVLIYPNPSTTEIRINTNYDKVNIIDNTGQRVGTAYADFRQYIDISNLSNGVYILEIIKEDQVIYHKMMKM